MERGYVMSAVEMDPTGIRSSADHFDSAGRALDGSEAEADFAEAIPAAAIEAMSRLAHLDAQQRARSLVRCSDAASTLRSTARQAVHVDAMLR